MLEKYPYLYYVLAAGGGLGAVLLLVAVCYCCRAARRRGSSPHTRRAAIRNSLRRVSLYISNTSPLELSVAELILNLTGGAFTGQPYDHRVTGDVDDLRGFRASPLRLALPPPPRCSMSPRSPRLAIAPPSYPPPSPPTDTHTRYHHRHHQERYNKNRVRKMRTAGPESRRHPRIKEIKMPPPQSSPEIPPTSWNSDSIDSAGVIKKNVIINKQISATIHHSEIRTPPNSAKQESSDGYIKPDTLPHHHTAHQPRHSPRPTDTAAAFLPDPPVESPKVVVSLFNTQKPSSSPTVTTTLPKSLRDNF